MTEEIAPASLWSDEPSRVDLLAFGAVADTVVDAVLDDELDPLAIGVSGAWGSGKTTVLRLVELALTEVSDDSTKILTVPTDPWRYDPTVGAKESLINDVLASLTNELSTHVDPKDEVLGKLRRLAARVDWAKALKVAARASLALQIPSLDDITGLVRADESDDGGGPRGLDGFREEFATLMEAEALSHVRRVVVLVDDLDRCLPATVVETLETIRLFLAVRKMSFVLAADEDRVADAIREHYPSSGDPRQDRTTVGTAEEPAKLYLHKIVQTTIPVPALSRFDTEAYLLLLQLMVRVSDDQLAGLLEQCSTMRRDSVPVDALVGPDGVDIAEEMTFAARLTPLLYEKLRGNPRRVKRFLNDLSVRRTIAQRRGIALDEAVIAKLMVLEVLMPEEFERVLEWLAQNELREQIEKLEAAAGKGAALPEEVDAASGDALSTDEPDVEFADELVRWAKLPPALATDDLGPYLFLAAAFRGKELLDSGLPARLRDIATSIVSTSRAEQKTVTDDDLRALTGSDGPDLIEHLGRVARDRPTEQRAAIAGILRVARLHPTSLQNAKGRLAVIPGSYIEPATVLTFGDDDADTFRSELEKWNSESPSGPTARALASRLGTS
jgi:hypothetical protein